MVEVGVAAQKLPGQDVIGDAYLAKPFEGGVLVAAIDGLGHGIEAAMASRLAVAILEDRPQDPVTLLITRCHERIRITRGVVMSLASFSAIDKTMTWAGVGNIEGRLLRAEEKQASVRESLNIQPGIVGFRLPTVRFATIPISKGDTLIFVTDGIRSDFDEGLDPSLIFGSPPQKIADRIMADYSRKTDDALVLVARYVGD